MKKTALLAAVAAMFTATPALADGYVGAAYGTTDASGTDTDTWQVDGAFGHSAGSWGFQADASVGNADSGGSDADTFAASGHLYWQGSGWRLGGLVATSNIDDGSAEVDELVYGAEGTFDIGPNTVLGGSATFGEVDFLGTDLDAWNVDASLNYYATPNFRIGGTLGSGNVEAGTDIDTFTAGVDAEYQLSSAPVSFTLGYLHLDAEDLLGLETDTISAGVRWNFGGSTLRDRDNSTPFNVRTPIYGRALDLR
jgi:hypothetical protein